MKIAKRAAELSVMPIAELRSLHPDAYDGPVKHATRQECIEAILTEELSRVRELIDHVVNEDTPWWLDDKLKELKGHLN